MSKRLASLFLLALAGAIALPAAASFNGLRLTADPNGVVAHEWGTFTTVAGKDGSPARWLPLSGPSDLPCFVERFKVTQFKGLWDETMPVDYEAARAGLWGTVRMETPVIYFYAPQESAIDVRVTFPRGLMTEWYPRATVRQPRVHPASLDDRALTSSIEWKNVKVVPSALPALLREHGDSHYYPARETDAAAIQVGSQFEKFLFYRGVGGFDIPLEAVARDDGTIHLRNRDAVPIEGVIVFENRAGRIGYRRIGTLHRDATTRAPELTADLAALRAELVRTLTATGLYPREAAAMVETWRDSWFEDGVRLFYLVPRQTVDRILPLTIDPAPRQVARAFVGRMELITPETLTTVGRAIARQDNRTLAGYARFIGPIAERLLASRSEAVAPADIKAATNEAFTKYASATRACR